MRSFAPTSEFRSNRIACGAERNNFLGVYMYMCFDYYIIILVKCNQSNTRTTCSPREKISIIDVNLMIAYSAAPGRSSLCFVLLHQNILSLRNPHCSSFILRFLQQQPKEKKKLIANVTHIRNEKENKHKNTRNRINDWPEFHILK